MSATVSGRDVPAWEEAPDLPEDGGAWSHVDPFVAVEYTRTRIAREFDETSRTPQALDARRPRMHDGGMDVLPNTCTWDPPGAGPEPFALRMDLKHLTFGLLNDDPGRRAFLNLDACLGRCDWPRKGG